MMPDYEIIIDCGGSKDWRPPEDAVQIGPRRWRREWTAADYADRHCRAAEALVFDEKLEEALVQCEEALKLDPECAQAHLVRGLARHLSGDAGGAEADWAEAARLDADGSLNVANAIKARRDWLAGK